MLISFYVKLINSLVQELCPVKNFGSEVTILIPKTILPHLTVANTKAILCAPDNCISSTGNLADQEGSLFRKKSGLINTEVLSRCAAHIGMDGIRIEKEPRQETNM